VAASLVELPGPLDPDVADEVLALVERAAAVDGTSPLSEHVLLHLRRGGDPQAINLLARLDGRLAGYAHLDVTDVVAGPSAELAVHPQLRRRGVGGELLDALLALRPDLRLWAHGQHSAAAALATGRGLQQVRVLHRMRHDLTDLPEPRLPDGGAVRTFRVGHDEEAWLAVNARTFANHPEQGRWGRQELALRQREPWFDPAGFFLAEDRDGALLGFHWTKVHGATEEQAATQEQAARQEQAATEEQAEAGPSVDGHGHSPIGEVYVLGIDPAGQGRGLGRALTLVGLHHLRHRGLNSAILFVEQDNPAAVALYQGLGFASYDSDVLFRRP